MPCLSSFGVEQGLSSEIKDYFNSKVEVLERGKGELVCKKGVLNTGLFCVSKGNVKLAVISHNGNERVVEIVGPGGVFGEASMFLGQPCPVYAEALEKTEISFIKRSVILDAVHQFPVFAMGLINNLSQRLVRLVRDVEVCCLQPASERVMSFLLDSVQKEAMGMSHIVKLPAGKAVVASSLNLTPETFSRELHTLAADDIIQVDKRYIRIKDLKMLNDRLLGV